MSIEKTSSNPNRFEQYREEYLTKVVDALYKDPDHPEKEPRSRSIIYVPYHGVSEHLQQNRPNIILLIVLVRRLLKQLLKLTSSSILLVVKKLLRRRLITLTGM